jgi:hypothetical protein
LALTCHVFAPSQRPKKLKVLRAQEDREFIFVRKSKKKKPRPVHAMNHTAWKRARERAAEKWADVQT